MSNGLDPDQAKHSVWPDLGPTHLQKLSAEDKIHPNRQRARVSLCIDVCDK